MTCATEEGQALEGALGALVDSSQGDDCAGTYVVSSKVFVGPAKELGPPPFLAELGVGTRVEVVEVVDLPNARRVRARITKPRGWISLLNTETGRRWAERAVPLKEFDSKLAACWKSLGEVDEKIQELLQGDLLYLSAMRRFATECVPQVPTLEGPNKNTWTFSGEGLEKWRNSAGNTAHEVLLAVASVELRKAVLAGKEEYGGLLDAYTNQRVSGLRSAYPPSDAPFAGFLERLEEAKKQTLLSVGGSSGLSSATKSTKPEDVQGSEADTRQWLPIFAMVSKNTRISAADTYFGHALFGLCLRRLARRFELARGLGTLPSVTEQAFERARLEQCVARDGEGDKNVCVAAAQMESFAREVACPTGDITVLDTVLALSESTLAAIRRRTDFVFGQGLREELDKHLNQAREASSREDWKVSLLEATTCLMLEAASAGNLRMLSASPQAQERLAWDAIAYGAFLQDADDAAPTLP